MAQSYKASLQAREGHAFALAAREIDM